MLKSLQETKKAAEDGSSSGAAPAGNGQVSSSDSASGPRQHATSTLTATSRVSLLGTADGIAVAALEALASRSGGPASGGRKAGEPAVAGMGPAAAAAGGAGGRFGSSVSASAADTAALEKAEKAYRAREAEFKQALGLAAAS
eukprot:gene12024-12169_t